MGCWYKVFYGSIQSTQLLTLALVLPSCPLLTQKTNNPNLLLLVSTYMFLSTMWGDLSYLATYSFKDINLSVERFVSSSHMQKQFAHHVHRVLKMQASVSFKQVRTTKRMCTVSQCAHLCWQRKVIFYRKRSFWPSEFYGCCLSSSSLEYLSYQAKIKQVQRCLEPCLNLTQAKFGKTRYDPVWKAGGPVKVMVENPNLRTMRFVDAPLFDFYLWKKSFQSPQVQ